MRNKSQALNSLPSYLGGYLYLSLVVLAACTSRPDKPEPEIGAQNSERILHADAYAIRKNLIKLIPRIQEKFQIKGVSLALVKNQEILWAEGFGYADEQQMIPATAETVYRAGSLAKPFTALAVLQLEEARQLDIDQPLNAYLPEFSIRSRFDTTAEPITLRHILCHHSGLPTNVNKGMWSNAAFTEVAIQLKEEYTAFPPNLVFSYSNVGYTLLGHMIQKVSGERYVQYMEDHIFQPVGMQHSGMRLNSSMLPHLAKGYRDGSEAELLPIRDLPAYALYTSAADLGRFMTMILARGAANGREILMAETLEEMLEPQNAHVPLDLNIIVGLGMFLETDTIAGGGRVVRHGGTTLLYSSELILLPDKGLGIAVLANSANSRKVVSRLAEEILRLALETQPEAVPVNLLADDLSRDTEDPIPAVPGGTYATDLGLISIRPKDAKLCACIIEETFDLIPYPNGWFGVSQDTVDSLPPSYKALSSLRFQTLKIDGKEVIIAEKDDKQILLGEKIPPGKLSQAWLNRVGGYELLNPDEQFLLTEPKLLIHAGQLCMSYTMPLLSKSPIRVPLRPISDTEAVILGLGRTRGETLRAIKVNGEEILRYSGYKGRKRNTP